MSGFSSSTRPLLSIGGGKQSGGTSHTPGVATVIGPGGRWGERNDIVTQAALAMEAADPSTLPERLRELGLQCPHGPVRRMVAHNPNTPPDVLQQMAHEFLEAVLTNPIAPLLPLEMPDFLDRLNRMTLLRMTHHAQTPPVFVRLLANHHDTVIAAAAARHIAVAGEIAPESSEWEEAILQELAALPLGDPKPYRAFVARGVAPEWLIARLPPEPFVVGAPKIVGTKIELVGTVRTTLMRFIEFAHCRLDVSKLHRGAESFTALFRIAITCNPDTPPELCRMLAEDADRYVRAAARARQQFPDRKYRL